MTLIEKKTKYYVYDRSGSISVLTSDLTKALGVSKEELKETFPQRGKNKSSRVDFEGDRKTRSDAFFTVIHAKEGSKYAQQPFIDKKNQDLNKQKKTLQSH